MSKEIKIKIESVSDLLTQVAAAEKNSAHPGMGESLFWYRGQSNEEWELQPAVLRKNHAKTIHKLGSSTSHNKWNSVLEHERLMNQRFRNESYSYLGDIPPIRLYFAAQHHKLPTRLLDWSLSPLVALYFACRDKDQRDKDGCVHRILYSEK